MKILPLTPLNLQSADCRKNNYSKNITSPSDICPSKIYTGFAYRDYNISFTGRTPEDFYAQDFNRNNMPSTMKDYLYYDYELRQHIPPEQMMKEVFKYLSLADSIDDVKNIYPNEELFKNIHKSSINARKGLLSEIKVARDLGDSPLLKDGTDDFGLYLLKKIYLEGKTVKEISKDFLEKDINDEYKGFITEPVKYSTLSAYGISYPNISFWNSFINTRDEYKKFFVTLPKNSYIPGVNVKGNSGASHSASAHSEPSEKPEKKHSRNYNLKPHKKKEIAKDIIDKKPEDIETVRKTVVRRFGKNDPEASFIVKYMSPIMTVAADRVHLSEEMKDFAEFERENGKVSGGKSMFGRFWKARPDMLEYYSYAITDTIEMFEDIYGAGGNIAINSDLERIRPDSKNNKIIDFVSPEFLELLDYTQHIELLREQRYAEHERLQKQWEEHFEEKYSSSDAVADETDSDTAAVEVKKPELSVEDSLLAEAKKNNAKVYSFVNKEGENIRIAANIDEVFRDELRSLSRFYPENYANMFINELTKDGVVSDKLKLSIVVKQAGQDIEDSRIFSGKAFDDAYIDAILKYHMRHNMESSAAGFAVADALQNLYGGKIKPSIYGLHIGDYDYIAKTSPTEYCEDFEESVKQAKPLATKLYNEYRRPLSPVESNKVILQLMDGIRRFNPDETILVDEDSKIIIMMLQQMLNYKTKRDSLKALFNATLESYPYSRSVLQKGDNLTNKQAKCEKILESNMYLLLYHMKKNPYMVTIFNKDTYNKYKNGLSPEIKNIFDSAISKLSGHEIRIFEASHDELKRFT